MVQKLYKDNSGTLQEIKTHQGQPSLYIPAHLYDERVSEMVGRILVLDFFNPIDKVISGPGLAVRSRLENSSGPGMFPDKPALHFWI